VRHNFAGAATSTSEIVLNPAIIGSLVRGSSSTLSLVRYIAEFDRTLMFKKTNALLDCRFRRDWRD
jgi:hypothetical protein